MPSVVAWVSTDFALAALVVPLLALVAYRMGAVDITGYIAGLAVGFVVFWLGGWSWFLLVFYLTTVGSIFTRLQFSKKVRLGVAQEKGGKRGWKNVTANLVVGAAASLLFKMTGSGVWFAAFLGSVNSMASDTLATEIGLTSKEKPRLITNLSEEVDPGISGAITRRGVLAAVFGAAGGGFLGLAAGSALGWSDPIVFATAILGGLSGNIFDSFLGATVQARYVCTVCGSETERREHCDTETRPVGGSSIMDNDVVNIVSSLMGGSVAMATFLIL